MTDEEWWQSARNRALEIVETEGIYCGEVGCVVLNRAHRGGRPVFGIHGASILISEAVALPNVGQVTRHLCGNEACVNPNHLKAGTHAENAGDAVRHGRLVRGIRHPKAIKINKEDEDAIRADTRTQREIAAQYGIAQSTVGQIKRGEGRWTNSGSGGWNGKDDTPLRPRVGGLEDGGW
ncbi:hypothetical protein [Primorskyibacter sp. S87]|uniref:hypothetical protein n=1 Tax=Primorskyibacter sp. S87 TaxID=3415126 RepID=UPI003C7AE73D